MKRISCLAQLRIKLILFINEQVHEISNNIDLKCVDSDEPLQPPFKLRHSKCIQSVAEQS